MSNFTIDNAIDDFIIEQWARLNAPKTIKDYGEKLNLWATFAGQNTAIESITTKDMRLYIGSLRERNLARETIRSYITALKVAWKFWASEYSIDDVMQNIQKPVKKLQPPKSISTSDFVKLFEAAKGFNPIDWRNRALIALLADTGARRGEILSLTTDGDIITLAHLGGWRDLQTIKDAYAVFDDNELSTYQAKD